MKIYAASVQVNNGNSHNHYPLISGVGVYNSCQDYLDKAVIPYAKQSPTFTSQTKEISINIVEGEISAGGLIKKTGGLDETLYF